MFRLSVVCLNFKIVDFIKDGMTSPSPPAPVSFFHLRGIFTWHKLIKSWSYTTLVWKDEADFFFAFRSSWSYVRLELQGLAILSSGSKDVLAWYLSRALSPVCVKDLYAALSLGPEISNQQIFPFSLWKVTCPLKTNMALFLEQKILHRRCYRRRAGRVRDDALCVRMLKSQTSICSFNVLSLKKSGMNFLLGFPSLWFFLYTGRFFLVE